MQLSSHFIIRLHETMVPEMLRLGLKKLNVPMEVDDEVYADINQDENGRLSFEKSRFGQNFDASFMISEPAYGRLNLDYMFRDGNNYKQFGMKHWTGLLTPFRVAVIYTAFNADVDGFTASDFGLECLYERWNDFDPDAEGTGHDVDLLSFEPKGGSPETIDEIEAFYLTCLNLIR
jgi:hypothetical protein